MADGKTPRKWSLEEIDELLQDSGMLPKDDDSIDMVEEIAPSQKTEVFNPRPSHNDKIKHRIIKDTVEKSDGVAEPQVYGNFVSEKYRDRFFNKPIQNIEKTSEHTIVPESEQKYERGGFIKKKSNFSATSDFTPVPNLVPDNRAEENSAEEKTMVIGDIQHTKTIGLRSLAVTDGDAHDIELPDEQEDMQLAFEGFHTAEVDIVDEREVEEELIRKRKEKVSSFTITGEVSEPEEDTQKKKYGTDEYRTADEKFKVAYYIKKKKMSALTAATISFVCSFVLLIVSVVAKSMVTGGQGLIILSLALTILAAGVSFNQLLDGIKAIKSLNFNRNTGCFFALLAVVVQNIVFLTSSAPFENGLSLLNAAAILYLGLNLLGEYIEHKRIGENFSYLSSRDDIYSIGPIEKKGTAFEIGRGLLLDDPSVLLSQKTLFPRRFIEFSRKYYPSDSISKKLVPIGAIASVLVGLITLLVSKDILSAITAFTASACVCMPYLTYIADSAAINKISKRMRSKGAMIAGWEAFKVCENANAVAVDSCDIFDAEGGNVYGIHPFYDIGIDEAIIYTATLAVASGGPLGNLFKRVIVGELSLLPPVDTLIYEDKLGLSAWIFNRRVLVGSEDLLRNHNVDIPDTALIAKHLSAGRYPLYLAIDGKAAAVFIISYDVDEKNRKLLREIEGHSISLLVRSDDANITDELVSQKLSLPQSGVKVISAVSGDIYKSYVKETTSVADALLIHDGKANSFLYAIKSALSLGEVKSVLSTFQICAMGIGIALVGALSFVSGPHHLGCLQIMATQGIFTALCAGAILSGNAIKNRKNKS